MTTIAENIELRQTIVEKDREIAKLRSDLDKVKSEQVDTAKRLKRANIRLHIGEAGMKAGVLPAAIIDLASRAESAGEWDYDQKGNFRLKDADGYFDKTVSEWVKVVKADIPFYFTDYDGDSASPA